MKTSYFFPFFFLRPAFSIESKSSMPPPATFFFFFFAASSLALAAAFSPLGSLFYENCWKSKNNTIQRTETEQRMNQISESKKNIAVVFEMIKMIPNLKRIALPYWSRSLQATMHRCLKNQTTMPSTMISIVGSDRSINRNDDTNMSFEAAKEKHLHFF